MLKLDKHMLPDPTVELQNPKSSKRRSAAKKLRKVGNPNSCLALLEALKKEIQNKRTWETQYHMVMAIGQSGCSCQINDLNNLIKLVELEPMVRVALADTITRLEGNSDFLYRAFELKDINLISGALRAMALEQINLPSDLVDKLIDFTLTIENDLSYFWIAAAAPGCESPKLKKYLNQWAKSDNEDISKAAKAALENKYLKWSIL